MDGRYPILDPMLGNGQQNVSRRIDTSLQDNMSVRPDAVLGPEGHSGVSATGVQGNELGPVPAHAQQVMSPNTSPSTLGFHCVNGFQEPSSSMAASYDMACEDAVEDEISAVERSTFEDLISQVNTSQSDTVQAAQHGDRTNNYMFLQ